MLMDPIADMLTRIRNAQHIGRAQVAMPSSKQKVALAKVLQNEGYIQGFEVAGDEKKPELTINLKYLKELAALDYAFLKIKMNFPKLKAV